MSITVIRPGISRDNPLGVLGGYDEALATIEQLRMESRKKFRGGDLRQLAIQDAILDLAGAGAALHVQMAEDAAIEDDAEGDLDFGEDYEGLEDEPESGEGDE